jgi:transposase-like protein
VRFPLSLRDVKDLLQGRGIDICHETVRFWWNRFGPLFAGDFRKRRLRAGNFSPWRWHADEVFVKVNGELWPAVDHEGEVLEFFVTKRRDKAGALRFLTKAMKRYGRPEIIVTDGLRAYRTASRQIRHQHDEPPDAALDRADHARASDSAARRHRAPGHADRRLGGRPVRATLGAWRRRASGFAAAIVAVSALACPRPRPSV